MKKWIIFGVIGIFTLLNGVSYGSAMPISKEAYAAQDTKILSVAPQIKKNKKIERAIREYTGMSRGEMKKTKLYYNYADLNKDGKDEVIVLAVGPYTSGSGGDTAYIIVQAGKKFVVNQALTLVRTPIIISDKVTNGCKEIIVRQSGGGILSRYVVLTCHDGAYTTVNDGKEIANLSEISGQKILEDEN